jgi:hypothetical protein
MKKAVKIFLLVFLIIIIVITLTCIYFYYFHVFKTLKICISNNKTDLLIPCIDKQQCKDLLLNSDPSIKKSMDEVPTIMKQKIEESFDQSIICEGTCKIKEVKNTLGSYGQELCLQGEKEIALNIRGKEAIDILLFIKSHPELNKSFNF